MKADEQLFPILEYAYEDDFPFIGRKNPEVENLKLEWVDPADIFVTVRQKAVFSHDTLQTILEDFNPGRIKSVNIARILGVNICWNGQHTVLAMMLNGWEKVPCMVYECEDMRWRDNSVTHMRFSERQIADLAYDFLVEEQELLEKDSKMTTFADVINHLEQAKAKVK